MPISFSVKPSDDCLPTGRLFPSLLLPATIPLVKHDPCEQTTDFEAPIQLPADEGQSARWQAGNRQWWESHPMRYDWREGIAPAEGSAEYFAEMDRRLFATAREFMPWKEVPFDPLIDFRALAKQDVLEIGVGCGAHAALLAAHARSFVGIDLTDYAVNTTAARLQALNLPGRVLRMDAEHMDFPDQSFNFIWSWGVIHHSANTRRVLAEMRRVLRPGGRACVMVYHRSFWHYYVVTGLIRGVLMGKLVRTRSLHRLAQDYIDGALARFYTPSEWKAVAGEFFTVDRIRVYGAKLELIPLPAGQLRNRIAGHIPDRLSAFITNDLRQGHFLVADLTRA